MSTTTRKSIDLTGQKFGRWTVLPSPPKRGKDGLLRECLCDCGSKRFVLVRHLLADSSTSCGCTSEFDWKKVPKKKKGPNGETLVRFNVLGKKYRPILEKCIKEGCLEVYPEIIFGRPIRYLDLKKATEAIQNRQILLPPIPKRNFFTQAETKRKLGIRSKKAIRPSLYKKLGLEKVEYSVAKKNYPGLVRKAGFTKQSVQDCLTKFGPPPNCLTCKEIAKKLKVSVSVVQNWCIACPVLGRPLVHEEKKVLGSNGLEGGKEKLFIPVEEYRLLRLAFGKQNGLTTKEFARKARVPIKTVYEWYQKNYCPVLGRPLRREWKKLGKGLGKHGWVLPSQELEEFKARRNGHPEPLPLPAAAAGNGTTNGQATTIPEAVEPAGNQAKRRGRPSGSIDKKAADRNEKMRQAWREGKHASIAKLARAFHVSRSHASEIINQ